MDPCWPIRLARCQCPKQRQQLCWLKPNLPNHLSAVANAQTCSVVSRTVLKPTFSSCFCAAKQLNHEGVSALQYPQEARQPVSARHLFVLCHSTVLAACRRHACT